MFGNKAQMQNMLKKARKMQEDMQKIQEELKQQTVDVSVGGGAVALIMNGEKKIVSLKIAKDAIDPEDPEMFEDLITTAVNEAGKIYNRKYRAIWTGSEILYAFHFSDPPIS